MCAHPHPCMLRLPLITNLLDDLVITNTTTLAEVKVFFFFFFFFLRYQTRLVLSCAVKAWLGSYLHMHPFTFHPNNKYTAQPICFIYFFTFLSLPKIYFVSCIEECNYISLTYRKVLRNSLLPEALWVMPLSLLWQKHNNSASGVIFSVARCTWKTIQC